MRVGKLNRRITIQKATESRNSYGEVIKSWADYKTVWASVQTTGGGEFYAAQKVNEETEVLFTVRYQDDIYDHKQHVVYDGRTYEIVHLNEVDGAHRKIEISAKEVVA